MLVVPPGARTGSSGGGREYWRDGGLLCWLVFTGRPRDQSHGTIGQRLWWAIPGQRFRRRVAGRLALRWTSQPWSPAMSGSARAPTSPAAAPTKRASALPVGHGDDELNAVIAVASVWPTGSTRTAPGW